MKNKLLPWKDQIFNKYIPPTCCIIRTDNITTKSTEDSNIIISILIISLTLQHFDMLYLDKDQELKENNIDHPLMVIQSFILLNAVSHRAPVKPLGQIQWPAMGLQTPSFKHPIEQYETKRFDDLSIPFSPIDSLTKTCIYIRRTSIGNTTIGTNASKCRIDDNTNTISTTKWMFTNSN